MSNSKSVSVIIPNYNNAKWLPDCLDSCLVQGELLKEIVIVDDHSTDGSLTVLKEYKKRYPGIIKIFTNPEKGANHARNYGFEKSSGNYIQWLDSDDLLLEDKFKNQIEPLVSGKADIVYSDWQINYWDEGYLVCTEKKLSGDFPDYLLELIKDNWINSNNYLITRSFAEKLSCGIGWNPSTKVGQDREYFTMAGILGARFKYVGGVFSVYNKQKSGTISGIDFQSRLQHNQILEKRLREEIIKQRRISNQKIQEYISVLDTHKLKACFYDLQTQLDNPIPFKNIKWELMHWKMRTVMPAIYIYKHIQYYL